MFGRLLKVQGNKVEIELEDDFDFSKVEKFANGKQPVVELKINDGRTISPDQRKKIYALINDLCEYTGDVPEYWKEKFKFMVETIFGIDEFSLSDCSVTVGNYMILTILEFLFQHDIPFRTKTWDSIPNDFPKQMLCIKNRRCVICGKPADRAHVFAVGMGRNRNKIHNRNNYVMTLCREHHQEQHNGDEMEFIKKYHIKPIKVTEEVAKEIGWKY